MSALDEAAANAAAKKQSMSFAERMAARDKARKAKWAKARAEKTVDADEDPAVFWQKFGGESDKVAQRAEAASTEAEIKQLEQEAATLRSKVSDAAAYLTQYDIKRATAEADQATNAVKEAKERICPREKYAFAEGTVHVEKGVEKIKFADRQKEMSKVSVGGEIPGFRNEQGKVLVVDKTWSTQVHLEDLKDCVVFAPYPLQTLRLVRLENCHVFSRDIAGPCYVPNCVGCVFRVVPRQLRIHDTTDTTFHVASASGPIIEACDDCRFAAYACTWSGVHAEQMATFVKAGAWRDVQDFKWLKTAANPHWRELDRVDYATKVPEQAASVAAEQELVLLPLADLGHGFTGMS